MIFSKTLIHWYSIHKRNLPWRETNNPYYIWLSEIILQQTQVKQGLPYYEAFVSKFPSVFDLANADESDVLKLWQGLGYYSRARNLHASAKYVANELEGVFPNNYKDLLKLKGVGDYTASAIASICFNEAAAVVDGNVYRVLSRYFDIETPINSSKGAKEFKTLAQELIDAKQPANFNQAIMEFGATQCKPKNPNCTTCPFNSSCLALKRNKIADLPVKIKSAKAKKKYFNFLVFISEDEKTILEKRKGKGIWQNLYQFPLVETDNELTEKAFKNLVLDHDLLKDTAFKMSLYNKESLIHKLSHQHLYTKFWIINTKKLPVKGVSTSKIREFAVPILIGNFIESFNF
ncbi:A/G-specific adenine glycosylase [Algibacter amylolyticus]|uniref:Adenine DNA glycosylase n=1 Tax=Algibacter amylolyticus TaxID=1608400 RepID=A0A5M7BKM8_9FLAO|nr:A/G-specific adenine glycosylase [Algibacter amylolyticus]KAA5827831.1 A/G-specific adenine glycosylase [Algibacter amylolyticus]MBB5267060.1 A/G-specific adenine glycosylase [Algibacter amylolyticus]TSJ82076.1 A/G-specific adenine glycosylase [Algibacter amylolyticus]